MNTLAPRDPSASTPASLGALNASVAVPDKGHWWFRLLAFLGPGYMISAVSYTHL